MAFTTFDLSTAEFPDSGFSGTYSGGMLVPDVPSTGQIFWLPGMERDLSLYYLLVVDYELTGEAGYDGNPRFFGFAWRNDGDYGSSTGDPSWVGSPGRKTVESAVAIITPGGHADELRVAIQSNGSTPPVTRVRWEPISPIAATGGSFPTAQSLAFGQVYSVDWSSLPDPSSENAVLGTPDVAAAAWFKVVMPSAGALQSMGGTIALYSGSSLDSLTLVSSVLGGTQVDVSAGTYYARTTVSTSDGTGFTSDFAIWGYQSEARYGEWTTPAPQSRDFTLSSDGNISHPSDGATYTTQQAVDAGNGSADHVATWEIVRVTSDTTAAPPFDAGKLADALLDSMADNPVTPTPPATVDGNGWQIHNASLTVIPGNGWRDYGGGGRRVGWFLSLDPITATPSLTDPLATGWENQDGTSDVDVDAPPTSGALAATFQHQNAVASGGTFSSGSWSSTLATIAGASLNGSGNVAYDLIGHAGAEALWTFGREVDNDTEDKSATVHLADLTGVFGFVQWTDISPSSFTEDKKGSVGTYLLGGTFTVSYQAPAYRQRIDGVEVLLPLSGEVVATILPPLRQYPRNDGLGASSTRRAYPPPQSVQASNRRGPSAII